jgi:hypothetical protein
MIIHSPKFTRIHIACPHCNGLHQGESELGGYVAARWAADRKVEACRIKMEGQANDTSAETGPVPRS